MNHVEYINNLNITFSETLKNKLCGRYYTHEIIARNGIKKLIKTISQKGYFKDTIKVIDPFGGDGRLIIWFIEEWEKSNLSPVRWEIYIWDINETGLIEAKKSLKVVQSTNIDLSFEVKCIDSFQLALESFDKYDVIVTNPPWEILKPDRRELVSLNQEEKQEYTQALKNYDSLISSQYPLSQPLRKFAGWGTNLSRVGLELCTRISKKDGFTMIILPASFFADDQSIKLREEIFTNKNVISIDYYPAEAKLFKEADTNSTTLILTNSKIKSTNLEFDLSIFEKNATTNAQNKIKLDPASFRKLGFIVPINTGYNGLMILEKLSKSFETWGTIEKGKLDSLWAGREIDETGSKNWLIEKDKGVKFIKGRMIDRFQLKELPYQVVEKKNWKPPSSIAYEKIIWRDVSRPSQKRRLIATIAPKNVVAGNSLGVCYYKDDNPSDLRTLLGIMNSLCFEFQLRTYLATGHVSLSSIRKVHIPNRANFNKFGLLSKLVSNLLSGGLEIQNQLEAYVAKVVYNLTRNEFKTILDSFPKLNEKEKKEIMIEFEKLDSQNPQSSSLDTQKIPNHKTASLSELDMIVVNSVPPGGNWKNLPEDIPSKRVQQIRESYKQGKGSRSTYYGRLLPDKPSYTINTYFSRPGNGCHIHYEEDRVLSQREAARLQSFPDNFIFQGSQSSINNQIGNAVPPLLAYQLAQQVSNAIGKKGIFVDLFSGAGGLGLGFKWAGWKPILANDIDKNYLKTYSQNIHPNTIVGSISNKGVFDELVNQSIELKKANSNTPFWVLGGPPCQGFSTAGNKRTMDDERNLLFYNYVEYLEKVAPDGFVFENVAGLLNMEKGNVFKRVKQEFEKVMPNLQGFILNSENFAIPQRRKRVFLIGQKQLNIQIPPPNPLTSLKKKNDDSDLLKDCVSVSDALSDLPSLIPGQDGTLLEYKHPPETIYQKLMRGIVTPKEYLSHFA